MRRSFIACTLLVMSMLSACSHKQASGPAPSQQSLITRDDIEKARAKSALDAVQRYRADVLTAHAQSSILLNKRTRPVVFLNDTYLGQIDELRHLPAEEIQEIRIHNGIDATQKFGSQYGGGVIQIISRVS